MTQKTDRPKADAAFPAPLRTATLPERKPTRFDLRPDAALRQQIADSLGLLGLSALGFRGEIRPVGRHDFQLEADLVASFVQPCSITLAPVPGEISETVRRSYLSDWQEPEGVEVEMPEDDTQEPMPEEIDLGAVMVESLELALPLYPRAPGAELGEAVFAAPGAEPLKDADLRPFAGLAALRDRLSSDGEGEDGGK